MKASKAKRAVAKAIQTATDKTTKAKPAPSKATQAKLAKSQALPAKTKQKKTAKATTTRDSKKKLPEGLSSNSQKVYYQISDSKQPKIVSTLKLEPGDKILSINNKKISNQKQFYQNVRLLKNTNTFAIQIQRAGKRILLSYQKTGKNDTKQQITITQKELKRAKRKLADTKKTKASSHSRKLAGIKKTQTKTISTNKIKTKAKMLAKTTRATASKNKKPRHTRKLASSSPETAQNTQPTASKAQALITNQPAQQKTPAPVSSPEQGQQKIPPKITSPLATAKKPVDIRRKQSPTVKPPTLAKKNLVPRKYKAYMQRAFISSLNSFIYKKPDFDAVKLYSLPIGKKILISRKIFRPHHNFGSFYKIFLFGEHKIVGYVSEAEVIPEYIRSEKDSYRPNPNYNKAKIYKAKNKVLNLGEITNPTQHNTGPKSPPPSKKAIKKQMGLSLSWLEPYLISNIASNRDPVQQMLIGLNFSGHNLSFLHRLSVDIKSSIEFQSFYLELSAGYSIIKSPLLSVLLLGGATMFLSTAINSASPPQPSLFGKQLDGGPSGSLLALIPFHKNIGINLSAQVFYPLVQQTPKFSGTVGLQYHF